MRAASHPESLSSDLLLVNIVTGLDNFNLFFAVFHPFFRKSSFVLFDSSFSVGEGSISDIERTHANFLLQNLPKHRFQWFVIPRKTFFERSKEQCRSVSDLTMTRLLFIKGNLLG